MADKVHVLGVKRGDQNISLLGKASLSINDSIFSMYNIAKLIIKDDKGLFKEQCLFFNGENITVDYGWPDKGLTNSCEYTITDVKAEFGLGNSSTTTYYLTNSIFGKQRIKSRAFKNRLVSDIIKGILTADYKLKEDRIKIVTPTTNLNTWYQGNITDAKFIQDFLLPNAYSSKSGATPIYSYFTSDGIYHFISLSNIVNKEDIKMIFVSPDTATQSEIGMTPKEDYQTIQNPHPPEIIVNNIQKLRVDMRDYYADLMKTTYVYQWANPKTFVDKVDSSVYVFNGRDENINSRPLWFKVDPSTRTTERTGWDIQYQVPATDSEKTSEDCINKSQITQRMASKMFMECYMFTSRLFPQLHAGDLILLQFNNSAMDSGYSKAISDLYVILSSEHIYNVDNAGSPSMSKFVVGRPHLSLAKELGDKHTLYRYPLSDTNTVNDINGYFN